jgi:hypothetical protein
MTTKKSNTNLNDLLPDQLRSAFLTNLNKNLFNRYLTKDNFVHTVGIIGDPDPTSALSQIAEPTAYRQEEQLQPVANATVGTETQYLSFQDFLNRLSQLGVDITQYSDWGKALQFNMVPPIDLDKLVNYRNYYWNSTSNTETPDYITIKNEQNWASARAFEFMSAIASLQPSYTITLTNAYTATISGNYLSTFFGGDQVLLSNGAVYYSNTITSITLNPTTGVTVMTFSDAVDDTTVNSIYSLYVDVNSISPAAKQFVLDGNWSTLFINGYIFLAPLYLSNLNTLFSVASSTYNNTANTTTVTVNETIPLTSSWNRISLYPLISLTQQELNSVSGNDEIIYDAPWTNEFLGAVIWNRELQLVSSNQGYSYLGDHGIYDNTVNFVEELIRPGDYLEINTGPITGTYLIISVESNFLGIDSSVRMFTKENLSYVINRETYYDYLISATAPTNPVLYQYWSNSTNDTLNQWNGTAWITVAVNYSLLVNATHQRYKLSLTQTDPWSTSNKWINKNQVTSYSSLVRAQLPIIEFDPFLELSSTSSSTYEWQYRKNTTALYSSTTASPNLFEISNIRLIQGTEFLFVNDNTIVLDQSFGNLTGDIPVGSSIKLSGFTNNNGTYTVTATSYFQRTPTSRFTTSITLGTSIDNPFDLPINASIGPVTTSQGDPWLGYDQHWLFYGLQDISATSVSPTENPALSIFVNAYADTVNNFETNVGLAWQSYSYTVNGNTAPLVPFDPSLQDLVLYDDYQEGDLRVYINGIRQYGNFRDIQSTSNPDYVGSIQFENSVTLNEGDLLRIEMGEYALEDVGLRSVSVPSNINLVDPTLPYNLVNLTNIRKMEQDKDSQNEYPWFTVYDINGDALPLATIIFGYEENSTYPLNQYILKRIVYNSETNDYGFVSYLSDPTTGALYSYKNFSQPNYPLQTIWKRGLNNEQYQPSLLPDGSWDIPNPWFYNIDHTLETTLMYSQIYNHFYSIINAQQVPGVVQSTASNMYYVDDNINFGLAGTIKEHNTGLDLLVSSVFVNNVNPLVLIQFGHDRYMGAINFIQDEYLDEVGTYLTTTTYQNVAALQTQISSDLLALYESNGKFNEWFGDSTTFDQANDLGVKSWIATLPYLNLSNKYVPYLVIDTDLGIYDVVCHDGHREHVVIQPTLMQKLNNYLISKGATRQVITSNSQAFPTGSPGALLIRVNTTTGITTNYRYSQTGIWEVFDYRIILANILLNIETQLYDNCPTPNLVYDFTTLNTNSNYNSFLNTQFSNYASENGLTTPLINTQYSDSNPFTWNYEFTPIQQNPSTGTISYNTAADYHTLYTNLYGTPYPHREPWAIQGYIDMPSWWTSTYADPTGTRIWTATMWSNVVTGLVPAGQLLPNGNKSTGIPGQAKVYQYIPVNMNATATSDGYNPDDLLPPFWNSSNTTNSKIRTPYDAKLNEFIISPNLDYTFGDGNINEWNWNVSAQRLYDNLILAFKIDPQNFTNVSFNGLEFVKINCLDVDPTTSKVFSHKDTVFHGELINNTVFQSNGLNQWYVNYNRYYGYDGDASQFEDFWKTWDTNLCYLMGSYTDTSSFSISNSEFDITSKDYTINVKQTIGFEDIWMDTLQATVLSVPSKYSTLRDNGIGWTVQFNTTNPNNNNIQYYPKENFDFFMAKGSNIFEIYAYDLLSAGIVNPVTTVTISYSESLVATDITTLLSTSQYSANIAIGGENISIVIKGSTISTINDVITQINEALSTSGSAYISSGNLVIQSSNGESIVITDNGLFATMSPYFLGIQAQQSTSYEFDKSFDINGNLTSLFVEGDQFTISGSTQFNGTYSVKSVYYDIVNTLTKIFVNESVTITSDIVDGIVRPVNRRTLPDTWVNGTEVYLSTMSSLPAPFSEYRQYYLTRLTDYTFQLSLVNGGAPIVPLAASTAQQFVGRIQYTFKATGGSITGYTWRQHYSDTRQVLSYAQPIYISGIQQMIDFIDGYSDYMAFLGFNPRTTDIMNTENGMQVSWQTELESFIDDLYTTRATNQNQSLSFGVTVDVDNSRFLYIDSNVSLASAEINTAPQIVFSVSAGGSLPDPISNPLKEYLPYYAMPSRDGLGFQIAYTQPDAIAGNYIDLQNAGSGTISFTLYTGGVTYPVFRLNPYRNALRLNHPQGILSNVLENDRMDILTNQKLYDVNGNSISPKKVFVLRDDEYSQVFLTDQTKINNATANNPLYIAGMHAFLDSYEHIVVFNDTTVSGGLIYDPFLGIRTPRFYVDFNRQTNYTLRPNVGGYFIYNNDLVQNIESSVDDLRYMNDAYTSLESKPLIQSLRQSMGYAGPQDFLSSLNINSKTDFIFWRGMIKNKGTNFAIDAYINQPIFSTADLDEFWAYRLASFGDSKEQNYPEMKLMRQDSVSQEARFEFVNPEEDPLDQSFTGIAITDQTRWWNQPDVIDDLAPNQSYFISASVTSITYNQQSNIQLINGNYILLLDKPADGVVLTYTDPTTSTTKTLTNTLDYKQLNRNAIQFTTSYNPTTLTNLSVSTITYNYNAQSPSVLVDKTAGVILDQVLIWNPAVGQHYTNAYALIDYVLPSDPASQGYTEDFTGNVYNNIWQTNNLDKVWLDNSALYYVPYNDAFITPDTNDMIDNWGQLAANGALNLYQWTESTVPPAQYTTTYNNDGIPRQVLYINNGTYNDPIWQELFIQRQSFMICTIDENTVSTLGGTVNVYRNGIFDYTLNTAIYTLYQYAYGALLPNQTVKPSLSDTIVLETILPVPTPADITALTYKYDTPYSTSTSVNATNGQTVTTYYFWVTGRTDDINISNYTSTLYQAQLDLIANPDPYMFPLNLRYLDDGYGILFGDVFDGTAYGLPLRYTQLVVRGLNGLITEENRFALRFIDDFTLRDKMPFNGDIYDYNTVNPVTTPLSLKNKHVEWKLFREKQSFKIDSYLWDRLVSALVGYNVTNGVIDTSTTIPALDRVLFDQLYGTSTRFGLSDEQIFVDPTIGLNTIQAILNDPTQTFINIDIISFLQTYDFSTVSDIVTTMYAIYESFDESNINYIYFQVLNDAMSLKKESPDFFKTSWVGLDISQNVNTTVQEYSYQSGNIVSGGACDIDENIVVPTPPPLPSPSPTPSLSASVTPSPSATVTPSITASVSVSATVTPTPSVTTTPFATVTPSVTNTPAPTITPTNTGTPEVTPTITVSPTITASPSITATPTITPTSTPVGNSCYDDIVLLDNPLVYYRFDDINTNIAADYSGNNNAGYYQGDILQNQPGLFSTSARSIEIPNDFNQNNFIYTPYGSYSNLPYDFTFEITSNATAADQDASMPYLVNLAYNTQSFQPQFQLYIDTTTGVYVFEISTSDNPSATVSSTTLADGNPHLITCRRMGDFIYIFIDGEEEARTAVSGTNNISGNGVMFIGGAPYAIPSVNNYIGNLDNFSLYGNALADSDIANRYECIAGIVISPSPTPTVTVTPSPTTTPTVTPSATPSPTRTVTPSPTPTISVTRTVTPTPSHSAVPSPTPAPSNTPAASSTPAPTATPTPSPAAGCAGTCEANDAHECVSVDSYLPDGRQAKHVQVGDTMHLGDHVTLDDHTGVVSRSKPSLQASVLIITENGVELECSTSAPIPTKDNGFMNAPLIKNQYVPTQINGVKEWSKVIDVVDIGEIWVQNITVENKCFWAGKLEGKYLLHHNEKDCTGIGSNCTIDGCPCCCS